VVERERVRLGADGTAEVTGPAPPGRHVRAEGEDFPAGRLLIPAGHRLRPADLAAAAAAGHDRLTVARPPVAAIIPTGDEVRPSGSALGPGEITDSNSVLLAARATEVGALPVVSGVQPDDPAVIAAEVRRAARAADLVLVIAGSSAGRRDHTATALRMAGGLTVCGVAVRPGHPVLLGHASRTQAGEAPSAVPVIGVPGYPLAAAVIFELFAVPLLATLHRGHPERPRRRARLACDWIGSADVEEWVPVSLAREPDRKGLVAIPAGRGAGSLSRLLSAHAWWRVPLGAEKFLRGERIDVRPISGSLP
jgi:putative molybdopterin biosynthesis protein